MKLLAKTGRSAFGERSGRTQIPERRIKSQVCEADPASKIRHSPLSHSHPLRTICLSRILSIRWADISNNTKTKKGARETGPPVFTGIGAWSKKVKVGAGDGPEAGRAHPEAAVLSG